VNEAQKQAAGEAAAQLVESGMTVGLGTGSTAALFVRALAKRRLDITGVATSVATASLARSLGIRLAELDEVDAIDLTIDGADEIGPQLSLIKGGGAAHTREKIVNYASRRNVIIVDGSKMSKSLGEKWPVPVEVVVFAHLQTHKRLEEFGRPVLRQKAGSVVRTDAGNVIYDVHAGEIRDPAALDRAMRAIPGVVETGLFIGRADVVLVAEASGVRRLTR